MKYLPAITAPKSRISPNSSLATSEVPDEMLQSVVLHLGLHCLLMTKLIFRETFGNIICDLSIKSMDLNFMENSIGLQRATGQCVCIDLVGDTLALITAKC